MADSEIPERLLNDLSIQRAIAEIKRSLAKPDVIFRSLLIKIAKPMDEFVALLNALFYHVGLDAASNHFLTAGDRVQAVSADLAVLVRELEDIERSEEMETDLAATIARERKLLAALRRRLERAVRPGSRRSKQPKRGQ